MRFSERVNAGLDETRADFLNKARAHAGDVTDEEWARYVSEGPDGAAIETGALFESFMRRMNEFEADVLGRLGKLENGYPCSECGATMWQPGPPCEKPICDRCA